jgi:uncharacterized membrane protein
LCDSILQCSLRGGLITFRVNGHTALKDEDNTQDILSIRFEIAVVGVVLFVVIMSESIRQIAAYASVVLYLTYAHSGLVLGLCPFLLGHTSLSEVYSFLRSYPGVDWFTSIRCLAAANVLHSVARFGIANGLLFLVYSMGVIFTVEEIGLRTGWPFGEYHFTEHLGPRISERLPLNVLVLWTCLLYPALVWGLQATWFDKLQTMMYYDGKPQMKAPIRWIVILYAAGITSLALAGFDMVSEPVASKYGYQVWGHCATVDSSTETYVPKPDWIFAVKEPHKGEYDLLNYFDIPFQVFAGITSLL